MLQWRSLMPQLRSGAAPPNKEILTLKCNAQCDGIWRGVGEVIRSWGWDDSDVWCFLTGSPAEVTPVNHHVNCSSVSSILAFLPSPVLPGLTSYSRLSSKDGPNNISFVGTSSFRTLVLFPSRHGIAVPSLEPGWGQGGGVTAPTNRTAQKWRRGTSKTRLEKAMKLLPSSLGTLILESQLPCYEDAQATWKGPVEVFRLTSRMVQCMCKWRHLEMILAPAIKSPPAIESPRSWWPRHCREETTSAHGALPEFLTHRICEDNKNGHLLLTMPKPLTVWITINCGKFWKWWEYQTTWPSSWETYMQVRKQQLELGMEQQTGSK